MIQEKSTEQFPRSMDPYLFGKCSEDQDRRKKIISHLKKHGYILRFEIEEFLGKNPYISNEIHNIIREGHYIKPGEKNNYGRIMIWHYEGSK